MTKKRKPGIVDGLREALAPLAKLSANPSVPESLKRSKAARDHKNFVVREAWKGFDDHSAFEVAPHAHEMIHSLPNPFGRGRRL
jgi:hypothetical protein